MDPSKLAKLEEMFPDGLLLIYGNPDGVFTYYKYNPRRVALIEEWEKAIHESTKDKTDTYWKGFQSAEDIPEFPPEEWR